MWATRLWWQLRFFGFESVSVLDRRLLAWRAAGLPTESGARAYEPAQFSARPRSAWLVTRAEVEAAVAPGGGRRAWSMR